MGRRSHQKCHLAIDRRTWFTGFAIAITNALVAGLIASTGEVPGWEQSIFHAINDLPDWLVAPMWVFQPAGLLLVPLVIAVLAAAFQQWWLAIALVIFTPLKLFVERAS